MQKRDSAQRLKNLLPLMLAGRAGGSESLAAAGFFLRPLRSRGQQKRFVHLLRLPSFLPSFVSPFRAKNVNFCFRGGAVWNREISNFHCPLSLSLPASHIALSRPLSPPLTEIWAFPPPLPARLFAFRVMATSLDWRLARAQQPSRALFGEWAGTGNRRSSLTLNRFD